MVTSNFPILPDKDFSVRSERVEACTEKFGIHCAKPRACPVGRSGLAFRAVILGGILSMAL
jgi:hypothetical protein